MGRIATQYVFRGLQNNLLGRVVYFPAIRWRAWVMLERVMLEQAM